MLTVMPGAGRMCGANSSMSAPSLAPQSRKQRSIALASSTPSRRPSMGHRPSGDNSSASSNQSRLPRHWPLGPTLLCASSPENLSSPKPSATCERAGPRWCVIITSTPWNWQPLDATALPPEPVLSPSAYARSPRSTIARSPFSGVSSIVLTSARIASAAPSRASDRPKA
jgi:hypothetical protein